jgi:hypothetical protein
MHECELYIALNVARYSTEFMNEWSLTSIAAYFFMKWYITTLS